jgi:hypothetical protein
MVVADNSKEEEKMTMAEKNKEEEEMVPAKKRKGVGGACRGGKAWQDGRTCSSTRALNIPLNV